MGNYQSNTSKDIGRSSTWAEFEDDWFDEGASRRVYRGTYRGNPQKEGTRCVVKVFKEDWYDNMKEHAWKVDERAYRKANEMAESFNKYHTKKYQTCVNHLEFVEPELTQVDNRASFRFLGFLPINRKVKGTKAGTRDSVKNVIPSNASVFVERYLEGNYIKFTNNFGYVHPEKGAWPSAFSHFTYHASGGEILVGDLQGVMSGTRYTFTDPAVHSVGTQLGYYGPTDLGIFGIAVFFNNHTCNKLCKGLERPEITKVTPDLKTVLDKVTNTTTRQKSSAYTYQLTKSSGVPLSKLKEMQCNQSKLETITDECTDSDSDSDVETQHKSATQRIGPVCPIVYSVENLSQGSTNAIAMPMLDECIPTFVLGC